ncbi:MAG: hypothetical protein AAGL34_18725 [Bacteroidota bacterium]
MKIQLSLILSICATLLLNAQQDRIELDPGGAAGGDIFGLKVTATGNNATKFHIFKNFTGDSQDYDNLVINANRNIGMGTNNPLTKLHIYNGASGKVPHGFTDFVVEDNHHGMINILTPSNYSGYFGFADATDDFVGGIQYNHTTDIMYLRVNNHAADMVINKDGNVGIGTTTPAEKLRVSSGTSGDAIVTIEADTDNSNEYNNPMIKLRQDGGALGVNIGYSEENFGGNVFGIGVRHTNVDTWDTFTINTQSGNIGIGTKTPDSKLAVNGEIHTKEVKVDLVGWSDFVFEKGYDLPSLEEVEHHISDKGHLQDIPSAADVASNGIKLGEMDAKLLQKIEELMLYTIQQQKEIDALLKVKKQNDELAQRIHKLETLINHLLNTQD